MGCVSSSPAPTTVGVASRHQWRGERTLSTSDHDLVEVNPMAAPSRQRSDSTIGSDPSSSCHSGGSLSGREEGSRYDGNTSGYTADRRTPDQRDENRPLPWPATSSQPTHEAEIFQSVRESTPTDALQSGALADDEDTTSKNNQENVSSHGFPRPNSALSAASFNDDLDAFSINTQGGRGMGRSPTKLSETPLPDEGLPTWITEPGHGAGEKARRASGPKIKQGKSLGSGDEQPGSVAVSKHESAVPSTSSPVKGSAGPPPLPRRESVSIFEFKSFQASLMLGARAPQLNSQPRGAAGIVGVLEDLWMDDSSGAEEGEGSGGAQGRGTIRDASDELGPLLDSMHSLVSVEELLKQSKRFPSAPQQQDNDPSPLSGSTSTARLSVNSASSSSDRHVRACNEDTNAGLQMLTTAAERLYAFNSLSALAPHAAQDRVAIKKRLKGGYTDIVHGVRVYYPTPQERRLAREHELQHEARSRQVLCPGKGLLWSHPSVQEGLPCPLEVLERSYEREPFFVNNPPWYADVRCRGRILQFLFAIQQFLPSLMAELTDSDRLASKSVSVAITMVEELVAASHRESCRHVRIRILLTQLLVHLRDTIVLLEEPERFLQEFSKVNEAELIDLIGDVSLSQQTTDQDLTLLFQALKRHQANLFLYVLLMIDNCAWMAAVAVREQGALGDGHHPPQQREAKTK